MASSSLTENEIKRLPKRARIAFAAHCVRRVQDLFAYHWPDAPEKYVESINRGISLVEAYGMSWSYHNSRSTIFSPIFAISMEMAEVADCAAMADAFPAAFVADAATCALDAVDATEFPVFSTVSDVQNVADAAGFAVRAAKCVDDAPSTAMNIRQDFENLLQIAKEQRWTDATPVHPDVFCRINS